MRAKSAKPLEQRKTKKMISLKNNSICGIKFWSCRKNSIMLGNYFEYDYLASCHRFFCIFTTAKKEFVHTVFHLFVLLGLASHIYAAWLIPL
ncbi:hypothetical protein SAMN05216365_13927 [Porphyromonadaceae bacterium NLAE-zl-C104]|nr:hypothetical protein SAMN05216331_102117 [Porphyromonadaceae bacterium KH3R12]SFS99436.1 hypothetical protein SAMN05216365_13927 [Porphyromonadaceae bacterium NLAE-zl-C104]